MANRKTGARQESNPTHGQTGRPENEKIDHREPTRGDVGQQQDPKHRSGAFERAGDHARQQQMGNKD